jgi:hypothetical protein
MDGTLDAADIAARLAVLEHDVAEIERLSMQAGASAGGRRGHRSPPLRSASPAPSSAAAPRYPAVLAH